MIPYSRQTIEQADIDAVLQTLTSGWLTTGPQVDQFERAIADFVGVEHAVAVNSGTAALHSLLAAAGIGPGDEVIVPGLSFVATANAVLYVGARPVFADITLESYLLDPQSVADRLGPRTKAVVAVDFAGHPCDYSRLRQLCDDRGVYLLADSCHALGAKWQDQHVAQWVDGCVYSFHPVKPMTTCEGGMIVTRFDHWADRARRFRNHGLATDHHQRSQNATWWYDMVELGFNYRLSDLHCALGLAQLKRLGEWQRQRTELADRYRQFFKQWPHGSLQTIHPKAEHAYHLLCLTFQHNSPISRDEAFVELRNQGIGANVHYRPIYQHSYYRRHFPSAGSHCPATASVAGRILSLPLFPTMSAEQVEQTLSAIESLVACRHAA